MGCASSIRDKQRLFPKHNKLRVAKFTFDHSCNGAISTEECLLVTKTWKVMNKDLQGNGMQLFLRIFELDPDVKRLFSIEHIRPSDVVRNAVIKGHALRFMQAIGAAVDRIYDFDTNDNDLDKLLHCLGQQHTRYVGFNPDYFEVFYEAIMWQWERYLGKTFTQEVADAWSHLFAYVMWHLKEGYYGAYDNQDTDCGSKLDKYNSESEGGNDNHVVINIQ